MVYEFSISPKSRLAGWDLPVVVIKLSPSDFLDVFSNADCDVALHFLLYETNFKWNKLVFFESLNCKDVFIITMVKHSAFVNTCE